MTIIIAFYGCWFGGQQRTIGRRLQVGNATIIRATRLSQQAIRV